MVFSLFGQLRRRGYARQAFPEDWLTIVKRQLPFFAAFSDDGERERFLTHLWVFAKETNFEIVGGQDGGEGGKAGSRLEVTNEMRVVISGSAARLSRNLNLDVWSHLSSVIIYPSHYNHPGDDAIIYGEANSAGVVVLSWNAVTHGVGNPFDGHDTAVHEFAHVLDAADGAFDGTPLLHRFKDHAGWNQVMSKHYLTLKNRPHRNVLRAYGATNEAEFFAVATEAFFEKPRQLKRKAPDLYGELQDFYRCDPEAETRVTKSPATS